MLEYKHWFCLPNKTRTKFLPLSLAFSIPSLFFISHSHTLCFYKYAKNKCTKIAGLIQTLNIFINPQIVSNEDIEFGFDFKVRISNNVWNPNFLKTVIECLKSIVVWISDTHFTHLFSWVDSLCLY